MAVGDVVVELVAAAVEIAADAAVSDGGPSRPRRRSRFRRLVDYSLVLLAVGLLVLVGYLAFR